MFILKLLKRLFTGVLYTVDITRRIIVNLIFIVIVIAIIGAWRSKDTLTVEHDTALAVSPQGQLVEQVDYMPPLRSLLRDLSDEDRPKQTVLRDVIAAIDAAKGDTHIKLLTLELDQMEGASPSQLEELRDAIARFKTSGKKVLAYAENYAQSQYYLAAQADEVYLDPMGGVLIEGFAYYDTFLSAALNKLEINYHIFRVGEYKSAVERFLRNDMSKEAKEANRAWLTTLWEHFKIDLGKARKLKPDAIETYANGYVENLRAVQGDTAQIALKAHLVDGLKTRHEWEEYVAKFVGQGHDDSYNHVHFEDYALHMQKPTHLLHASPHKVAVVVAKGVIEDGSHPTMENGLGADALAQLIREAREDESVKALVLRVDSPGGSVTGSERIRQELELTQRAGKPVIASMSGVAASGGYWISSTADEIWANPTTITGSIGIFGMFPTFEKPLAKLGIHRDGLGTTQFSNAFDVTRPLSAPVAETMQQVVNHGYRQFIELVAHGRDMSSEDVEVVARGRVWSGEDALRYGLIDKLGGLKEAVAAAAHKANLEDYEVYYMEEELSTKERVLKELLEGVFHITATTPSTSKLAPSKQMSQLIQQEWSWLQSLQDPKGLYAHCLCGSP